MATIPEVCVFTTKADSVVFETTTNGDKLCIDNLELNKEQAASLAWLINNEDTTNLKFKITLVAE